MFLPCSFVGVYCMNIARVCVHVHVPILSEKFIPGIQLELSVVELCNEVCACLLWWIVLWVSVVS